MFGWAEEHGHRNGAGRSAPVGRARDLSLVLVRAFIWRARTTCAPRRSSTDARAPRTDERHSRAGRAGQRAEEEGRRAATWASWPARSTSTRCSDGRSTRRAGSAGSSAALDPRRSHTSRSSRPRPLGRRGGGQAIAGPPDGRPARSIYIAYHYPAGRRDDAEPIHGGLAVPLTRVRRRSATSRSSPAAPTGRFDDDDVIRLEQPRHRAGPAIENARRFREARRLADLDALTGLHNRRYFHETLAREVARAHRYNRKVALVVFDLDDFKDVNDRIGHLAGDSVLAEASERLRDVVRTADIACRIGGDEFAVIMPESGLPDAERLHTRVRTTVSERPIGQAGRLFLSAGISELPARRRLGRALRARGRGALPRQRERQGPRCQQRVEEPWFP